MTKNSSNPIWLDDLRLSQRWRNYSYLQPGIRHELAGPQNALGLHVQLLSRAMATDRMDMEKAKRWVAVLEKELQRLYRLSESSLGVLAPDRSDPRPASVTEAWSRLAELLEARGKEIAVRISMDADDVPDLPLSLLELEDLILDLTVEALERLEADGGSATIEWSARREGDDLLLTRLDHASTPPADGGPETIEAARPLTDEVERPRLLVSKALARKSRGRWASETDAGGHRITIRWPATAEEGI